MMTRPDDMRPSRSDHLAAPSSALWVTTMTGGSPAAPLESVTKSQPAISSDSHACLYLRLRLHRRTSRSICAESSSSPTVKPSNRLREAMAETAFFGQPTTVSMLRSDGGMEMPRSFSTFSPS
jgi:hypothetical protein